MNAHLLYLGEGEKFDQGALIAAIKAIEGVHDITEHPPGAFLEWHFHFQGDAMIGRISTDLQTISLRGDSLANLKMASEINARYPGSIHLMDTGYTFDLVLGDYKSFEALLSKVEAADGA